MADVRQPDDVARELATGVTDYSGLTKAELLEVAANAAIDVPAGATKDDILAALGAH